MQSACVWVDEDDQDGDRGQQEEQVNGSKTTMSLQPLARCFPNRGPPRNAAISDISSQGKMPNVYSAARVSLGSSNTFALHHGHMHQNMSLGGIDAT